MPGQTSDLVQRCLVRLKAGDPLARRDLLVHSQDRLRALTSRMLAGFPNVRRWEDTDDVLQSVLLKVDQMLDRIEVETVRDYLRLAAAHIRHVLVDLARHYYGPHGPGAMHASPLPPGRTDEAAESSSGECAASSSGDPHNLARWGEFHERVAQLADAECEVFDLIWYHGLTQEEAAEVLGLSLSTVKRRWQAARLSLMQAFGGEAPF